MLSSDDSIEAAFEAFTLFEKTSGPKLNLAKSKGLWLGGWSGRSYPPVQLDRSSSKLKVLGVFGNLEEDNWRPRIDAVDHFLKSWRTHPLSFRGKALAIKAIALSRVWYVASLIHMPAWVCKELSFLAFSFFWSDKREPVSRSAVTESPFLFWMFVLRSMLFLVSGFASSPSDGSVSLSSCFFLRFGVPPLDVFSQPFSFDPSVLPPFYKSLLLAWWSLNGSYSPLEQCLLYGLSIPLVCAPVLSMSTSLCYRYLLSENMVPPYCVQ